MAQKLQILRTADGYGLPLPMYESKDHMGLSLMAAIPDVIKLETGDIVCLPVGFAIGIPRGLCGFIVSVPELVKEKGLVVTTAPALLNPADRGPIFVLIRNDSSKSQFINRGDVIAQLVITAAEQVYWDEVEPSEDIEATPTSNFWVDKKQETEEIEVPQEDVSQRRPVKSIRMRVK